jgi:hypothetical protein
MVGADSALRALRKLGYCCGLGAVLPQGLQATPVRYKRVIQAQSISARRHSDPTYRSHGKEIRMDTDRNCSWMWLQPASFDRRCLQLALLSVIASTGSSMAQGTPDERRACTPDAFRLCSAYIPDSDEITACLRAKNAELSEPCRKIISAGIKPSEKNGILQIQKRLAP